MNRALFDSNIVIDLLGAKQEALDAFRSYDEVAISVITWIEVMAGAKAGEDASVRRALAGYVRVELDQQIAERAAIVRRDRRLKLPDAVIFATAEMLGLPLVSRNEKDFPEGTPGVRVPYRL